jgi:S1-C subfamily serine protease
VTACPAEDVARLFLPAVVLIIGKDKNGNTVQGSGFFITRGLIVTNHHVIDEMANGVIFIN